MEKPKLNQAVHMLFPERVKLAEQGKCVECESEIKEEDFSDRLSIKEYGMSGLCENCQNKVFK